MKITKRNIFILLLATFSCLSCSSTKENKSIAIRAYTPVDKELYSTIELMDSLFFHAYNNCDLEKQALMYSENIEFYHDKGGLMTSKKEIIDGTQKYICGKVTRQLVKGSMEVYLIKDFGAVEIGFHKFYNKEGPDAISNPSKFIIIWINKNQDWKISKVISLH